MILILLNRSKASGLLKWESKVTDLLTYLSIMCVYLCVGVEGTGVYVNMSIFVAIPRDLFA